MSYEKIRQDALKKRNSSQLLQHMQIAKRVEHFKEMERNFERNKVSNFVQTGSFFK